MQTHAWTLLRKRVREKKGYEVEEESGWLEVLEGGAGRGGDSERGQTRERVGASRRL